MKKKRHRNLRGIDLSTSSVKVVLETQRTVDHAEDERQVQAWMKDHPKKPDTKTPEGYAVGFESMSSKGYGWLGNRMLRPSL